MPKDWLTLSWKALVARGVAAIAFGIAAMVWPIETAVALALLWGIWALVEGIGSFAQAFQPGTSGWARFGLIAMGVIAFVVAFFAILSPAVTAVTLTWILGIWLIVRGVFEVVGAFSTSTVVPRWLLLISALVDFVLGVLFVANPGKAAVGIAVVLGITALLWGIVFLVTGFMVRKNLANGAVSVDERPANVADPGLVGRISVFDRNGRFLRTIGRTGTAPGEFRTPHAIEFDSQGRLIVADRHNHRIQILTKQGVFVAEYAGFGRTSGLAIDRNDVIYTADSESTDRVHPGWQRGIRIGSLKDGKVTIFVPPHAVPESSDGAMGEGIAIDAAGNVYTAEAQLRGVTKYVRN